MTLCARQSLGTMDGASEKKATAQDESKHSRMSGYIGKIPTLRI